MAARGWGEWVTSAAGKHDTAQQESTFVTPPLATMSRQVPTPETGERQGGTSIFIGARDETRSPWQLGRYL